jgi:hypothetical protein
MLHAFIKVSVEPRRAESGSSLARRFHYSLPWAH